MATLKKCKTSTSYKSIHGVAILSQYVKNERSGDCSTTAFVPQRLFFLFFILFLFFFFFLFHIFFLFLFGEWISTPNGVTIIKCIASISYKSICSLRTLQEKTLKRNTMKRKTWKRKHGRENIEEKTWKRKH